MSQGPIRRQIKLRSFLLSTSFVGAGIGCFIAGGMSLGNHDREPSSWWHPVLSVLQILGAGPLIGAGILEPFGRARLGAYVGFFAPIIVGLGWAIYLVGWRVALLEPEVMPVAALTAVVIFLAAYGVLARIRKRRAKQPVREVHN